MCFLYISLLFCEAILIKSTILNSNNPIILINKLISKLDIRCRLVEFPPLNIILFNLNHKTIFDQVISSNINNE